MELWWRVHLVGTIIGSLAFARPADRYGRRPMLMLMGILYLASALGSAFAWDAGSFTLFRLIGGLGDGWSIGCCAHVCC